jgi:hypothetical protein
LSVKYAWILAGIGMLIPGRAAAQGGAAYGIGKGDRTATLSGSGINSKDFDDGAYGLLGSADPLDDLFLRVRQDVNRAQQ